MSFVPSDREERDRTRVSRGETLVLEAGAGTGKTTLLVDRIESLVLEGDALVTEIAAVTFTENAAATLKLRLRERLERARARAGLSRERCERAAVALSTLERAQVSTIHALCAAILQERPLECGVAPGFRQADEAQAEALFAESWDEWLQERLDASDPVLAEAVRAEIPLMGVAGWGESQSLRGLARTLLWQRDLAPLVAEDALDPLAWRAELLAQAARARDLREAAVEGDALEGALKSVEAFAEACRFLTGDALVRRLLRAPKLRKDLGRRGNWRSAEALTAARELCGWVGDAETRWKGALGSHLHGALVRSLQGVLARYEAKKRAAGVLDFVDLLVKARDALRDRESVRFHVRRRFRFVLIDEFQDTDPLQVEIADLMSAGEPGRLVVVGDAKQSIYRFRRADVALFSRLAAAARERPGHAVLRLRQNFRSRPGIVSFVNRAFATLITLSEDADQPEYDPIEAPPGLAPGAAVVALRFQAEAYASGAVLQEAEAEAQASFIARAAAGGYEVRDPDTGRLRASSAGDVMVLAPRLTQVRWLEDALDARGVACAVDGGKSFFDRQEVHEALATLRAIDDPSDRVSLVAALRSSFFGVSDRDLVHEHLAAGRLAFGAPRDEAAAGVAFALRTLTELHDERLRISVPALLERLYDRTRVLAGLTGTRRGEARIANLEKVAALARQAGELGVLTLRGFTRLLATRMSESAEEPDLPATRPGDPDTVRILSIHKAKGLEAPIVVLYDLDARLRPQSDVIALWGENRVAVGFRAGYRPPGWNALAERDQARARAEARRLLYVACTRARDWLVVPRPPRDAQIGDFWKDLLPFVEPAPADEVTSLDAATLPREPVARERVDPRVLAAAEGGDAVAARWERERAELLEAGGYRPYLPIAALKAVQRDEPTEAVAIASPAGRHFGSLVHQVLEWVDLQAATDEQVGRIAAALAPSFGLDEEAGLRAGEAASAALRLPVMARARDARRIWRELPLSFPDGSDLIEGVIDLVFEEEGGLVIVDYKTDRITAEQAVAQAAHHAPQLQLYGRGLAQAWGVSVKERLVLFTSIGQSVRV
jgi:ATP-dependent helicase/nuclease subunit A